MLGSHPLNLATTTITHLAKAITSNPEIGIILAINECNANEPTKKNTYVIGSPSTIKDAQREVVF